MQSGSEGLNMRAESEARSQLDGMTQSCVKPLVRLWTIWHLEFKELASPLLCNRPLLARLLHNGDHSVCLSAPCACSNIESVHMVSVLARGGLLAQQPMPLVVCSPRTSGAPRSKLTSSSGGIYLALSSTHSGTQRAHFLPNVGRLDEKVWSWYRRR